MPDTNAVSLAKLHASVFGVFAMKDKWITPTKVSEFKTAMTTANRTLRVKSYNADHAFANPSNPNYNKEAKEEADKLALEFLKSHL